MASPTSSTRSACDRCHSKKIRCVMTQCQDICDRCVEHNTSCVFSPAGRNGRPAKIRVPLDNTIYSIQDGSSRFRVPANFSYTEELAAPAGRQVGLQGDLTAPLRSANISQMAPSTMQSSTEQMWVDLGDVSFGQAESVTIGSPPDEDVQNSVRRKSDPVDGSRGSMSSAYMDPMPPALPTGLGIDILRSLQAFQGRLREESNRYNISTCVQPEASAPPDFDFGNAFRLMDELQSIVQRHLVTLCESPQSHLCTFTVAMSITTIMGNGADVYESIVRFGVIRPTTEPDPSHTYSLPRISDPTDLSPRSVQIGSFTPPGNVTRRIIVMVLVHQLSTYQQLLNQFYQHLLSLGQWSSSEGSAKAEPSDSIPNFFTAELRFIITQLLDQLRVRVTRAERQALSCTI